MTSGDFFVLGVRGGGGRGIGFVYGVQGLGLFRVWGLGFRVDFPYVSMVLGQGFVEFL